MDRNSHDSFGRSKRFVRLERSSYGKDIESAQGSGYLIQSKASIEQSRAKARMQGAKSEKLASYHKSEMDKFGRKIKIAYTGKEAEKDKLMREHANSSKTSPYLSGTPSFTTGQNSQLSYMNENLKRGQDQTVTIHQTKRSVSNRHNSREQELLLAGGERLDERIGVLHVQATSDKKVRPIFLDKTGIKPKLYIGKSALNRFNDLNR